MFTPEDVVLFGLAGLIVLTYGVIIVWEGTGMTITKFQAFLKKIIKKE